MCRVFKHEEDIRSRCIHMSRQDLWHHQDTCIHHRYAHPILRALSVGSLPIEYLPNKINQKSHLQNPFPTTPSARGTCAGARARARARLATSARAGGGRGRVALAQQQLGVRARGARQLQGFQGVKG